MASPLIVVVVALADSGDEASRAMARTVQDALADTALVVVREEAQPDNGALLAKLGDDMHATAVAVVHWSDAGHAQLRVYRTSIRAWTSRDVAFGVEDPPDERGRALGYGIASNAALAPCGGDASEGKAAVGEAGTQRGRVHECVPGAVCDTVKDNRVVCLTTRARTRIA